VTLYDTIRYYIYGGRNPFTNEPATGVEAFVRFGTIRSTTTKWRCDRPGWTDLEVPVAELTQIKVATNRTLVSWPGRVLLAASCASRTAASIASSGDRRSPDSADVFGVRNVSDVAQTGSVWFDDVRADKVIRDLARPPASR